MKQITKTQGGFTLIELLIVVAIIAVLSSLLMTNFVAIRQRSRDSQRKSELRQIQSALELYRSDIGSYPSAPLYTGNNCNASLASGGTTYMQNVPCDPLDSKNTKYQYTPYGSPSITGYCLRACLENSSDSQSDTNSGVNINSGCSALTNCTSGSAYNYTLQSP